MAKKEKTVVESGANIVPSSSNDYRTVAERRYGILELMAANSNTGIATTFEEIRARFGKDLKSPSTLSADLKYLAEELRLVEKSSHGKYELARSDMGRLFAGKEYGDRRRRHWAEKQQIAKRCIYTKKADDQYLLGDAFCFICHGSSTEPLFTEFRECSAEQRPQGVVTNSLPGFMELLGFEGVRLTVIGGRPELGVGGIRPLFTDQTAPGKPPEWLSEIDFNVLVLSCSSISSDGKIWCGDGMESFRQALLDYANERAAEIVILAQRSKLGSPGGRAFTKIDWEKHPAWLFLDVPSEREARTKFENSDVYQTFKNNLKDRFVPVTLAESDDVANT